MKSWLLNSLLGSSTKANDRSSFSCRQTLNLADSELLQTSFHFPFILGVSSRTLMKILRAGRGKCGLSDSKNNTRSAALDLHVNFQCKLELKSFRMSILVRTKQKRRTFHYAYI